MKRRHFLAAGGVMGCSGCLRLVSNRDTTSPQAENSPSETVEPTTEARTTESSTEFSSVWSNFYHMVGGASSIQSGDHVYCGTRTGVRAISTTTGSTTWEIDASETNTRPHGFAGAANDTYLYFTTNQSDSGAVYQLGLGDGRVRNSLTFGPMGSAPAVTDNYVIVGEEETEDTQSQLVCLDEDSFEIVWSVDDVVDYQGGVGNDQSAIVAYDNGSENRIESRDAATGEVRWSLSGLLGARMQVHDGALYIPITGAGESIWRVNPVTGAVEWKQSIEQDESSMVVRIAPPAVQDGRVYFAANKTVRAFDVSSGESLWEVQTSAPIDSSPVVHDGIVWVTPANPSSSDSDRNRQLLGFDQGSGEQLVDRTMVANTIRPFDFGDQLGVKMDGQLTAYNVRMK